MASNNDNIPADRETGLDLFAAAWLERLHSYGGTVSATSDGRILLGTFLPELNAKDTWQDGVNVGATRELIELARAVPGGREAIAAHIARFPSWTGEGVVSA